MAIVSVVGMLGIPALTLYTFSLQDVRMLASLAQILTQ